MSAERISDTDSLKSYFSGIGKRIIGVGVDAINRIGPEEYLPKYSMVVLQNTLDLPQIEAEVRIFCLERESLAERSTLNRNSDSLLASQTVQDYIDKYTNPVVMVYKSSAAIEQLCREHNWEIAFASSELKDTLENKTGFRSLLSKLGLTTPGSLNIDYKQMDYDQLNAKLGPNLVIQVPDSSGGKGTFFAGDEQSVQQSKIKIRHFLENEKQLPATVLVSEFVQGMVVSLTCVTTRWGTWCSNLQQQLIDIPQTNHKTSNGVFCGHDWSASGSINASLSSRAIAEARKFGDTIYKMGYRGYFGLDLILDEQNGKVQLIECNPRFTGVLPTLDMIQSAQNKLPFIALHLLEYLGSEDLAVDFDSIQNSLTEPKNGAHLIFNSKNTPTRMGFKIQPGVYTIEANELKYLRPGYKVRHLQNDAEFILTEFPDEFTVVKQDSRIGRLITRSAISTGNNQLNGWADRISQLFYNSLIIDPTPSN